jgi:glycylpeptide N-tetradecanoyltransferase
MATVTEAEVEAQTQNIKEEAENEDDDADEPETEGKDKKKKKKKNKATELTKESMIEKLQDEIAVQKKAYGKAKGTLAIDKDGAGEDKAEDNVEGLSSQEQLLSILRRSRICEESRRQVERPHLFWDTQPVPSMGSENFSESDTGPIDAIKTPEDVKDEPYKLPDAYEWATCNVNDDQECQEIYTLLCENYVEDDDSMFRFDYSIEFLRWALKPPEYLDYWHLGVRVKGNSKLVGFLSGIPANISVHDHTEKMVEINFLCVHKKLRSKRLAPVLIKEITRRVNKKNIWQAVYTAGVVLPRPVSECRYYHRSLNPKKLIDVGFSHLGPRMTMARTIKLYKVPDSPQLPGMREMTTRDVPRVFELMSGYLKKFTLHPEFTEDEIAHWMLPRQGVVYSFVRENHTGEVTDVCSFYALPSTILGNEKYNLLKAAYSYWNVATTVSLQELMTDALTYAKQLDFDVFNALNVMDNESFLKELKFGVGDGFLQYYLYNWKCPKIDPAGMGLVLL